LGTAKQFSPLSDGAALEKQRIKALAPNAQKFGRRYAPNDTGFAQFLRSPFAGTTHGANLHIVFPDFMAVSRSKFLENSVNGVSIERG
jgi:hypothetical protein